MIHEFAVEPATLSRLNQVWQAMEQFGVPHGRLISAFPKQWLRDVYEATKECPPVERTNLEIRLARLKRNVVRFRKERPSVSPQDWRESVRVEHAARPFHAIIQTDNSAGPVEVLTPFDLHEQHALWHVMTQYNIARTPSALAAAIGPLGRISSVLLFIDPYFSTELKWSKVFVEFLKACCVSAGSHRRIEVHTGSMPTRAFLEDGVVKWIVPKIPRGVAVKFVRLEQRQFGDKLHARYFLTELGGIRFDVGLDAGEPGETTDIGLLSDDLYRTRWSDFQEESRGFDLIDEFTVYGEAK